MSGMVPEVCALLIDALRDGPYVQGGRGRMSEGPGEGTHEVSGVLCLLGVKAGIIPAPTKVDTTGDITWLYRNHGDDAPGSCISMPSAVLAWAGLELGIGDPITINGRTHTWAGHMDPRAAGRRYVSPVTFAEFADALEVQGREQKASQREDEVAA